MTTKRRTKTSDSAKRFEASAAQAMRAVRAVSESLALEDVTPEEAANEGRRAGRVPRKAVLIAASVIERNPRSYSPIFDARILRDAIAYEAAMAPLALLVGQLADRITRNVRKRNGRAANLALAVYLTMKGEAMRKRGVETPEMRELRKLLTRNRKRRATTVTKKEMAPRLRHAKLVKIAVAKRHAAGL